MGITIVQKSDLTKRHYDAKKALILAGGAVTGGSFKAGGIKALNDYFEDFTINDFDIFVGISSGSMIAAALMAGISPESVLKSLDGTSKHFSELSTWHYYRPNFSELFGKPLKFLIQLAAWIPGRFAGLVDSGDLPSLLALLPSGIFDNRSIEEYIRTNIKKNKLTNDFVRAKKMTGKRLYISAMRLDGARRVIFGPDEDNSLTISEAVQASTALPGFYKPAHINGVDYVDGGVQDTANIDVAVAKGASLIVCYNPFRPYEPVEFVDRFKKNSKKGKRLASDGVVTVLNQIFRAFFHTRLKIALNKFEQSKTFKGDIILIEPRADDIQFFELNPFLLKNRVEASRLGFQSVCNSIEDRYDEIKKIFDAYGIGMSKKKVEEKYKKLVNPLVSDVEARRLLEGKSGRKKK